MAIKKRTKSIPQHRKPSLNPQHIDEATWFYDNRRGLLVVHQHYRAGQYIGTDQFVIPWQKIAAAMKRNGKRT